MNEECRMKKFFTTVRRQIDGLGCAEANLFIGPRYRSGTTEPVVPTIRSDDFGWINNLWTGRRASSVALCAMEDKAAGLRPMIGSNSRSSGKSMSPLRRSGGLFLGEDFGHGAVVDAPAEAV
jgi:hypothetical protein